MHLLIAASWLDPIVKVLSSAVMLINKPINNLGWSLVILAALIRLAFWPLNTAQFKAFLGMQKIAPQLKRLQAKYKDDKQKLQQETMALYKEHRVNPFAGCWPMLVQYPVIISVYYVVMNNKTLFDNQSWLWIGRITSAASTVACKAVTISPTCVFGKPILAPSLATPDLVLILLYAFSMYLSVRFVSMPATDPQQAQTQRMMAVISPLLLGFMGLKYGWPSAMVLYWFSYNAFTMAQQFYLLRRYHQPLALIDSEHVITQDGQDAQAAGTAKALPSGNGVAKAGAPKSSRGTRSKRKNKRGA